MARGRRQRRRTSEQWLEEFLGALTLEGRSVHSVRSYRRDLEPLLAALRIPLEDVVPVDLREHFRQRLAAGRAPSTVNHAIAAARSFFSFLVDNRVLDTSPAIALRSIRVGPSLAPKCLSVEEVEQLLARPRADTPTGVRDLALLTFLYNTGVRVGELCALSRADVQLPAEGWGQVQLVGKGRRLRWVPLNAAARRTLDAYLARREDEHPALFLNRSGARFSVRGVALLVNRYLQRIGVTDRSGPHLLRHTFATHSLRARPNLRAVQELLGHSSVTTTQRYTHMSADDLREQVAELPANCFGAAS
jgi:site-specific recombinase XerD